MRNFALQPKFDRGNDKTAPLEKARSVWSYERERERGRESKARAEIGVPLWVTPSRHMELYIANVSPISVNPLY